MSKTEYEMPKGYDIREFKNPDEAIVYKDSERCKCCGHDTGLMNVLHKAKDRAAAEHWLDRHIKEQEYARLSPEEQRTRCCD